MINSLMAKARISEKKYNLLLEAFREVPGRTWKASEIAGVQPKTAQRAWERGWDDPIWARTPIREIVEKEQIAARAELQRQGEKEKAKDTADREKAKLDIVQQRTKEAAGIRNSTTNVLAIIQNQGKFLQSTQRINDHLLVKFEEDVKANKISVKEYTQIINSLANAVTRAVQGLKTGMEAARLYLGEPEQIVGFVQPQVNYQLDYNKAEATFGAEFIKKVMRDLAEERMTAEVDRFFEWEHEQRNMELN